MRELAGMSPLRPSPPYAISGLTDTMESSFLYMDCTARSSPSMTSCSPTLKTSMG